MAPLRLAHPQARSLRGSSQTTLPPARRRQVRRRRTARIARLPRQAAWLAPRARCPARASAVPPPPPRRGTARSRRAKWWQAEAALSSYAALAPADWHRPPTRRAAHNWRSACRARALALMRRSSGECRSFLSRRSRSGRATRLTQPSWRAASLLHRPLSASTGGAARSMPPITPIWEPRARAIRHSRSTRRQQRRRPRRSRKSTRRSTSSTTLAFKSARRPLRAQSSTTTRRQCR
mmetsp:Transcript_1068/g.3547  ORF Transcript_1068/g.3547 Transcript_1068/m.3547 type:complete len:236 (-) Transcript_1068:463-1170(-)